MDRFFYAVFGAAAGAVVGVICWWLYGLAFSLQYAGPGLDPNLRHWVVALASLFAVLGFTLRDRVGSFIGDVLASIFNFEAGRGQEGHLSWWQVMVVLTLLAALAWYLLS